MRIPTVTVTSVATPTITWRCPTCHRPETFASSDRFRVNGNGKLLDIWLIYRCCRCDTTKNITVVERTPVRRVDPHLLRAAEHNEAATARRLTRDVRLLRRAGAAIAEGDRWILDGRAEGATDLRLRFPEPLLLQLDAVVATATGLARRDVRRRLVLPDGRPRPDARRPWTDVDVRLPSLHVPPPPGSRSRHPA